MQGVFRLGGRGGGEEFSSLQRSQRGVKAAPWALSLVPDGGD